jgi:hypothetical protein
MQLVSLQPGTSEGGGGKRSGKRIKSVSGTSAQQRPGALEEVNS